MRGREDAKGRLRSELMTPAVPERIRVLSPSESEQLDFCSRCYCTGE